VLNSIQVDGLLCYGTKTPKPPISHLHANAGDPDWY